MVPRLIAVPGVFCLVLALLFGGRLALAQNQGPVVTGNPAPTPEQMRALLARIIEHQHRNDQALVEYERVEHAVTRKTENGDILTDITERRVPSGAGDIKLRLAENGSPVSAELYRHELEFAVNALEAALHPDDRYREAQARFEKRRHDRAQLVDEAGKAFRITWVGRETRAASTGAHTQRTLSKYLLEPEPEYKPVNRFAASFQHVRATVWVDDAEAQIARVEADISTDITFGGGVAGKVYHGGHIVMEQEEVTPDLWLPSLYTYEVDGRKFLFAFGVHERTEISRYRRVGAPGESAEILRNELNDLSAGAPSR
jgi:hypothetical protein